MKLGSYNLGIGVIVSLFISLLASVPRILKSDDTNFNALLINITYVFTLSMFCWLVHHAMVNSKMPWAWANQPIIKFPFSILAGIIFSIIYHDLVDSFVKTSPTLLDVLGHDRKILTLIFRGLLISGFLFFVTYYLNLSAVNQQSMLENEKLKKENLQARLESLRQQISPHFLFNTLNTLSTLTREPKVKEYIVETSNVYRYLLQFNESDLVTVNEELKFVESYLYILRERFEEGLQVSIDINETTRQRSLPPLALQTLVENAIKHNIVSSHKPLHINIHDTHEFIVVHNNLQVRQTVGVESSNIGLSNIQERYRLLAGQDIVIEKNEREFIVKLPLLS